MTCELNPYPEYKDSGVEWIGEMPEEWELIRIKYLVDLKNNSKNTESLPYIGLENIESKTGKVLSVNEQDIESQSIKFMDGDVLFGKLRPYLAKATQVNFTGHCSTEFLVMTPKINNKKYLMYLMLSANFISEVNSSTYGTKMPRASWQFIGNITIPKMKEFEEIQIVRFLKQKTFEIDSLIEDKEKLIALLEEKRQAMITETVTKGIDPNVNMKDSGIEWIGEIPEHWGITKIKYTTYVKGRIGWQGLRSDEFKEEGDYYLVTGTDFKNGNIEWTNCYRISEERFFEAPEIHLKNGDILITKDGTIGKIAILNNKPEFATLNSGVFVTRSLKNDKYYSKYMYWLLNSDVFKDFVDMKTGGTTIKHLYQDTLINFQYPLLSSNEQIAISKVIDKYSSVSNELITLLKSQISKLKEYRESLIYEAVTGKIDLRNYEVAEKAAVEGGSSNGSRLYGGRFRSQY